MKPELRFSQTQNGYWCEYLTGDWSINGVSGFSQESPEDAEMKMWDILRKIRKAQLEINPMMIKPHSLDEANYPLEILTPPQEQKDE